jgi:hypothetical protein
VESGFDFNNNLVGKSSSTDTADNRMNPKVLSHQCSLEISHMMPPSSIMISINVWIPDIKSMQNINKMIEMVE